MAENKVRFLRGTAAEYAVAEKDSDTIYFTTDDGKLYIGDKEVSGDGSITIDDTLSDTSTNPVQNKVIKAALDEKADKTVATTTDDGLMSAADKTKLDGADDKYASKAKYGDTTINVGRMTGTDIGTWSTAEGNNTRASGNYSHAEGYITNASGVGSHAEGHVTTASGNYSHAGGYCTKALKECESAYGKYNESNDDTLFSIGDGTSDSARHNAFEITTTGGKLHDKDIAVDVSNPNLLINPDFKINQRGNTSVVSPYAGLYCVDRWRVNGTCTQTSSGVTVSSSESSYGYGTYYQAMENIPSGTLSLSTKCCGKIFSLTCIDASETISAELYITDSNGTEVGRLHTVNSDDKYSIEFIINSGCEIQIDWVKLEYGSVATPFIPPDPATELLKCQRYYQIRSENNIAAVDLRPNMRDGVVPTITALADGNYSYEAEL